MKEFNPTWRCCNKTMTLRRTIFLMTFWKTMNSELGPIRKLDWWSVCPMWLMRLLPFPPFPSPPLPSLLRATGFQRRWNLFQARLRRTNWFCSPSYEVGVLFLPSIVQISTVSWQIFLGLFRLRCFFVFGKKKMSKVIRHLCRCKHRKKSH